MTCSRDGVRLGRWRRINPFALVFSSALELILSIILAVSLAGHIVFPDQARAASGVPNYISYQGRLTDTSGNPLGAGGTQYCFRFSIYTASSGGTLLWPVTSGAMSTTTTVTNGVFNVDVGSATGDNPSLGAYSFSGNDTEYLNVEVNATPITCGGTWETLSPRQRLNAVPYARTAFELYGGNARVGPGTGVTSGNQKYLSLDVASSAEATGAACPTNAVNGSLWYNSATSRVLVCNNNIIGIIAATSSLPQGLQAQGAASAVTNGIINFSAQNNLTITQNGSTIQFSGPSQQFGMSNLGNSAGTSGVITGGNLSLYLAGGANITLSQSINGSAATVSIVGGGGGGGGGVAISLNAANGNTNFTSGTVTVAAGNANITLSSGNQAISIFGPAGGGGGGAANLSLWEHPRGVLLGGIGNITNLTALTNRPFFVPIAIDGNLTLKSVGLQMSRATSGSNLFTAQFGLYTYVNSTQISLRGSCQETFSNTATANISGIRAFWLTCLGTHTNASTVSPGNYVFGFYFSGAATLSMNYSLRGLSTASNWFLGQVYPGANIASTATNQGHIPIFGRYSTTHAAPIAGSYAQSQLVIGSGVSLQIDPAITIRNF